MGLEKAIKSGKEKRKQHQGYKIYASGCRNHGSCSWCLGARQHKNNKRLEGSKQELDEYNLSASENPEADFLLAARPTGVQGCPLPSCQNEILV